jgi:ketosteroid isomerase-like protein
MRKRDFAAGQAALAQLEFEAKSDIQEIEITGDRAYVWTRLAVTMTPKGGGASVKRAGHTLSILRKQNGAWVIYRDANLLAPVS